MAGVLKDFFKSKETKEAYWTCPRCRTQNPLGTPFCLKCAQDEEQADAEGDKVRLETEDNPLVASLIQLLNFCLQGSQIPSREVAQQAQQLGIVVNAPQEIALVPVAQLDRLADRFITNNRFMATGSGAVMGLPGGLLMLATIPTDISALTYYSLRTISGIAQSYGHETRSEEGRAIALLLFAGATGLETITVGGSQVLLSTLTKNVLTKPYRDMIMKRIVREVAKDLGLGVAQRGFTRLVPVLGSVVGGTANYMFISNVAGRAKSYYRTKLIEQNKQVNTPIQPAQPRQPARLPELGEDNPI